MEEVGFGGGGGERQAVVAIFAGTTGEIYFILTALGDHQRGGGNYGVGRRESLRDGSSSLDRDCNGWVVGEDFHLV